MNLHFNSAAVCGLLILWGCRSSNETEVNTAPSPGLKVEEAVPPDFEMVFGEGGGFAGNWSGHTIWGSGTVVRWSGPVVGAGADTLGTLDPDSLAQIWQGLSQIDFFSSSMNESGNITAFMRVSADGEEGRVSWIPGVESIEPPRNQFEALYRRTRAMVNRSFK